MTDRRQEPRAEVPIEVEFGHTGRPVSIRNVSMSGCTLFLSPDEWSVNDEVQLAFQLPGKSKKLCVQGIVKWRQRDQAGIQFLGCTYSQQVELAAFVLKHRQQSLQESPVA